MTRFIKPTDYVEVLKVNIEWQKERLAKEWHPLFKKQIQNNITNLEYKLAIVMLCYSEPLNLN
jgi:hypothetical protein